MSQLDALTDRELEVLTLVAEGRSNLAISAQLRLSLRTVETHMQHIFLKLGLLDSVDYHRRVLAVLTLLRASDDPVPEAAAGPEASR